jgi:cytochrome c-type biogenesis protein CcmF
VAFLATATERDFGRRIGVPRVGPGTVLRRAIGLPASAFGLYIGHGGLAIAATGVVAVSIWSSEAIQTVRPGAADPVGPYAFTLTEVRNANGPYFQTSIAEVEIRRDGALVATLAPERRWCARTS